jgi:hypothetical protein
VAPEHAQSPNFDPVHGLEHSVLPCGRGLHRSRVATCFAAVPQGLTV